MQGVRRCTPSIGLPRSAGIKPGKAAIDRLRRELKWHPMLQWEILGYNEARERAKLELGQLRQMLPQKKPKKAKKAK